MNSRRLRSSDFLLLPRRVAGAAALVSSIAIAVGCSAIIDPDQFQKKAGNDSVLNGGTASTGDSSYSDLRFTIASMTPHSGHHFEYRVIDSNNFVQSRGVVEAMSNGDTSIIVPRAIPKINGPYRLDFYADVNHSGGYDGLGSVVSNDHAWRIDPLVDFPEGALTPVDGVVQVEFVHNTSFTNVDDYPSGTPNKPTDTTLASRVQLSGLSYARGKLVEVRIADKGTRHVACLYRAAKLAGDRVDAVVPGCVDVNTEYDIDIYVDANDNGVYDDPSINAGDYGWRLSSTSTDNGLGVAFDLSDVNEARINVGPP